MTNQTDENKQRGFFPFIFRLGTKIAHLFLMQIFFIVFTLKGGVILGLFPSIAATTKIFIKWFMEDDDAIQVYQLFKEYWGLHFKQANQIGYTLLVAFGFLYIDLRINEQFIQSPFLHTMLLIIIFALGFLTVYTFPILVGHSLKYKDILKQSFLVSLSTPLFTIAGVLGLALAFELSRNVLFIGLVFGAPLIILPMAWFPYTGLTKIDELKHEIKNEETKKK